MWRRSHDRTAPLTLAAMAMVVALAGTSAPGYTQGSITGQIRAADTHAPLAGAMVSVWGSSNAVQTDERGRFTLDGFARNQQRSECESGDARTRPQNY